MKSLHELRNVNMLKHCLDHAYYDNADEIIDAYVNRSKTMLRVDYMLGLGNDLRRWIKVELNEDTDDNFKALKELHCSLTYEQWKTGRKDGKKLGKALLKNCSTDDVQKKKTQKLLTQRVTSTWLCMSRNIIDYIFASTNQSFTSCVDLESSHSDAFYLGLFALASDESRFMVFTTNKRTPTKSYTIHGQSYDHYSYINRSWCIVGNDNLYTITKYYPQKTISCRDAINTNTFLVNTKCKGADFRSIGNVKPAIIDGVRHFIYVDGETGVQKKYSDTDMHYTHKGDVNDIYDNDIDWSDGFNSIDDLDDIFGEKNLCFCCEETRVTDDDIYITDCGYICDDCRNDHYIYCEHCEEYIHTDYSTYVESISDSVCDHCLAQHYTKCDDCEDYHLDDYVTQIDDNYVCNDCRDENYTQCDDCEEYFKNDVINDDGYCQDCAETAESEVE